MSGRGTHVRELQRREYGFRVQAVPSRAYVIFRALGHVAEHSRMRRTARRDGHGRHERYERVTGESEGEGRHRGQRRRTRFFAPLPRAPRRCCPQRASPMRMADALQLNTCTRTHTRRHVDALVHARPTRTPEPVTRPGPAHECRVARDPGNRLTDSVDGQVPGASSRAVLLCAPRNWIAVIDRIHC